MTTMEDILNRMTLLEQRYLKIQAILEERQKRKLELEKECRDKGFDPENLEQEINTLTAKKEQIQSSLESKMNTLESELQAYES